MALQLHKKQQRGQSRMPRNVLLHEDPFANSQVDVFGHMNRMMSRFDTMMNDMFSTNMSPFPSLSRRSTQPARLFDVNSVSNNPSCHMYSSSAVMSMSMGPDGRPMVYQASTSTRALPGGIRETKKTLCDSRSGVKKMSLGHHIGERAHIIERQKNLMSGEEEEHQEYINLDEEEAPHFGREFEQRIQHGKFPIHAPKARSPPLIKPKGQRPLTPEVIPLKGQGSNKGVSQQSLRAPSAKGSKGTLKGALRKARK